MEETAVIAHLPNLEVRVVRRALPEEGAEIIGVQLKATPSFDAVAGSLRDALPGAPWLLPWQLWALATQQIWGAWLAQGISPVQRITRGG